MKVGLSPLGLVAFLAFLAFLAVAACGDDSGGTNDGGTMTGRDGGRPPPPTDGGSTTGGTRNPVCEAATSTGEVQEPEFVRNLRGQTSWFASPVVADLDGDGSNELVAAYYDVYVFDSSYEQVATAEGGEGRVYAPHVVADLEGDGITEIVVRERQRGVGVRVSWRQRSR